MPKSKKRKKRRKTTKKQTQDMTNVLIGIVLVLISLFSCLHFGIFSRQLVNCLRFLVGNTYYLASFILAIYGLVMIIYNQKPNLGIKRTCGVLLAYGGIMLWQSGNFFTNLMINHGFVNSFVNIIDDEFRRGQNTVSVGGGIIGSVLYQIVFPIFGHFGALTLAVVGMICGVLMIFNVKFADIVRIFQKFSQLFIQKNKAAGSALSDKIQDTYSDFVEKREQRKDNREKLKDPYNSNDEFFPNTEDFQNSSKKEDLSDVSKNESELIDDPFQPVPIEDSNERHNEQSELSSNSQLPKENALEESTGGAIIQHQNNGGNLPRSHSFEDEDNKIRQELSGINHGDFDQNNTPKKSNKTYVLPPLNLLAPIQNVDQSQDKQLIQHNTQVLESTFKSFGVDVNVKKAVLGPTVTRYEVQPAVGVKVSRIVNLADDLALALAAKDIRIEAPIPGKPLIGIEVPNRTTSAVSFKDAMLHQDRKAKASDLTVPLGKNVSGDIISADLRKMPHLLIAGSTGSGKSVAINTIITSILMKSHPEDVKLVLIDPKMVELSVYNGIPHLLIPVVTDAKLAANALRKTVKEMERRYKLFAASGVRNITEYNQKVETNNQDKDNPVMEKLPYIVVIVDELSDLMMVAGHDVEDAIVRLAQMARAAGIHMILATQRPSVDVITGLIKANVPSRIAFAVSSGVDSRTILDQVGAEKLLGRGDMLFLPIGASKPERVQGAFISVDEVEKVVDWVKQQQEAEYDENMIPSQQDANGSGDDEEPEDEFYDQAVELVRKQQSASVSMLQRRFRIGYNRAARIVDTMEAKGIVGPSEGSKPRQVLLPPEESGDS
ncbi:DNA translocase FtsK [Lactobacillus rodentium]|uniref:DNA translocase FtsK n=1 Tax=Lactobacillus rodentium TaxID=947835 RepID=A0A2Z6TEA1_9LACO|nr:DNA translocase FtsK [Lactobacillus rodentium]MCR1895088.1 DNA translocase FtsK [Lactobacillus rodentium]GBG05375.1 cell division protein FtsK [Lactobacillus rodentium]